MSGVSAMFLLHHVEYGDPEEHRSSC